MGVTNRNVKENIQDIQGMIHIYMFLVTYIRFIPQVEETKLTGAMCKNVKVRKHSKNVTSLQKAVKGIEKGPRLRFADTIIHCKG